MMTGMDRLLSDDPVLLHGRRVGLLAHPASLNAGGRHSAELLWSFPDCHLAALFSPEHGYFGGAGAGEAIPEIRHPAWDIPVYSLYGGQARPTAAMLRELDVLIIDLQDLSTRCYTYVSSLMEVLDACEGEDVPVIVTDRPTPWMQCVDGPDLHPGLTSFVGQFPGPMVYGLTPGEVARYLSDTLGLRLDLTVIPAVVKDRIWEVPAWRWSAPSPGIRHLHTAWCYPMTVGFEALPAFSHGRGGPMPFEWVGGEGVDGQRLTDWLNEQNLAGVAFHPHWQIEKGRVLGGVRISVMEFGICQPVTTAVALLDGFREQLGPEGLWQSAGLRRDFFDQLMGTNQVRDGLEAGIAWQEIVAEWDTSAFRTRREKALLYG